MINLYSGKRCFTLSSTPVYSDIHMDAVNISIVSKIVIPVSYTHLSIPEEHHLKNVPQIPFTWTMYRKRPQVRYTLASTIIQEIFWEVYPVGSYLPSLPKMAERYHVSLSTVRRTLDVLHSLGVTKAYMGVGTRVCMEPINPYIPVSYTNLE